MWQLSGAEMNPPTLAPGAVGWRRRWEGVRVLDWESRWEEGLQLYQRLVRWGKRAPPPVSLPSIGMFKWTVLISSSRSVPSPPGLEDKLAAECSFWPYVLNWRLGRLFYLFINRFCPEAGRNSFCIFKRQYLSFWASRLRWNFKHCCQMRCGSKEKLKIMRFSPFLLSNMFIKEVKKNLFMSVFHVHQAPWHVDTWVMR